MQLKKNPNASLEDKKLTYALLGFVFVLSVCFVALEWTEKVKKYEVIDQDWQIEDDVVIQQTTQETPPPPPPPAVQEVQVLTIVEDNVETEEINITSEETNKDVEIQAPIEIAKEEEEEDVVFVIVEDKPQFPGGDQAMMKWLAENIKYPVIAQENGMQGRVICQFVVNKDGSIVDIDVVRSVDPSLDKEAIRVIKSMPKWKPGKQRGKPVRVKFTLPVVFRLQ